MMAARETLARALRGEHERHLAARGDRRFPLTPWAELPPERKTKWFDLAAAAERVIADRPLTGVHVHPESGHLLGMASYNLSQGSYLQGDGPEYRFVHRDAAMAHICLADTAANLAIAASLERIAVSLEGRGA